MARKTILENYTFESFFYDNLNSYLMIIDPMPFSLEVDVEYTVAWDGVTCKCPGLDGSSLLPGTTFVGNAADLVGAGNGEPFCIGGPYDGALLILCWEDTEPTEHTVAIYQEETMDGDDSSTIIIIKDRDGNDETHKNASGISVRTPNGERKVFIDPGTVALAPDTYIEYVFNSDGEPISAKMHGFTVVPRGCFAYMNQLKSVDFSDSPNITEIGPYAFYNCAALENIDIPDGVMNIGTYAFAGCTSLESIDIPDSVTSISDYTFNSCVSLASVTLPENATSIGRSAFSGCSALESIDMPDSVESISAYAFNKCASITSLKIPDGVTSIPDYMCSECSKLASVTFGNGVTSIGSTAFAYTALTTVVVPNSVKTIGTQAFSGCSSLQSVTIGSSVEKIASKAFNSCKNLISAIFKDVTTWYQTTSSSYINGTLVSSSNLSNASTAATYLKTTYASSYWYKT